MTQLAEASSADDEKICSDLSTTGVTWCTATTAGLRSDYRTLELWRTVEDSGGGGGGELEQLTTKRLTNFCRCRLVTAE